MKDKITNNVLKLRRKALIHNWLPCTYYHLGYRVGYVKTQGRKWWHIVYMDAYGKTHVRKMLPATVTIQTLEDMRVGKVDARWEHKRITKHSYVSVSRRSQDQ